MNLNSQEEINEECEWLDQIMQSEPDAFVHFVDRYHRAVFTLCYRMLGTPQDAEDATQEAFLRAYKAIDRYDRKRKFSTWVLSIASNYCIDQLRKRRIFFLSLDANPAIDAKDDKIGPEGTLIIQENQQAVSQLMQTLNPKDRAVVIMRYWFDYSYNEIAEALSLTNSAVKSRLHRARRSMAKAWSAREAGMRPARRLPYETQIV